MPAPGREELIEETLGQMRRVMYRAMSSFGKAMVGKMPILPHMALHAALHRGGVTQSELAEMLGVSSAHITGLVDQLEKDGLVRRERDESDRRVVHVRATPRGRHEHHRVHAREPGMEWKLFEGWSEADIRNFKEFLTRMEPDRPKGRRAGSHVNRA